MAISLIGRTGFFLAATRGAYPRVEDPDSSPLDSV